MNMPLLVILYHERLNVTFVTEFRERTICCELCHARSRLLAANLRVIALLPAYLCAIRGGLPRLHRKESLHTIGREDRNGKRDREEERGPAEREWEWTESKVHETL
jgi:hypothetical protein